MRVFPGGRVEVVVPAGVGVHAVERFVLRNRDWAERRAREFALRPPQDAERIPARIELAFLARAWSVEYVVGRHCRADEMPGDRLRVPVADPADHRQVSDALLRWLGDVASRYLLPELEAASAASGIEFERVQLRRQRTRWGSCSSTGTISLNICLLFQRPEVARYLMLHELCHRRHMNHSARFWQLVESCEPQWRALDEELLAGWRKVPAWVFPD
jgi:predicted metal-dependent hydrolase